MKKHFWLLTLPLFLLSSTCAIEKKDEQSQASKTNFERHPDWNDYWYAGVAELSSYRLIQSRYGELREGHAVLVFVTEPFSQSKQVKLDYPEKAGDDNVSVLKMNMTKNFLTGIYPYSLMQSVFTPVSLNEYPKSLKTSMSGQEWCGHVFQQLNLKREEYMVTQLSYFESEGDVETTTSGDFLEDEIWTKIRIAPESLPVGKFDMIPGSFYTRLLHKKVQSVPVTTNLDSSNDDINIYEMTYNDGARSLKISFSKSFPYAIEAWEETFKNPFNGASQTTTAKLIKRMRSPYWQQNKNAYLPLRDSLQLGTY